MRPGVRHFHAADDRPNSVCVGGGGEVAWGVEIVGGGGERRRVELDRRAAIRRAVEVEGNVGGIIAEQTPADVDLGIIRPHGDEATAETFHLPLGSGGTEAECGNEEEGFENRVFHEAPGNRSNPSIQTQWKTASITCAG
jgi:hypothetical protein